MGRDMNPNEVPTQSYGGSANPHPIGIPDANRAPRFQTVGGEYPMSSTATGGGGMIMPDAECPLSPAGYGPGPGGFSIPEPMTNHSQVDPRSTQSVSFPSAADGGPPPIRHDSYPAPSGPNNYQQNSYPNQAFPAPPIHSNTWSQNDSWNPNSQNTPGYPNYQQRPPPPAAWTFPDSQQQDFPPQAWPHPSNQAPPPPSGGGYPPNPNYPYGGGY